MSAGLSPLVSAVIPVYNAQEFVAEAIRSVLDQSYKPVEIIAVDDGSTDSSAEVVAAFGDPVRLVRGTHSGIGGTRNHCVREARGEFLAFLDADDLWPADKLRKEVGCLLESPDVGMVFGGVRQFYHPGLAVPEEERIRMEAKVLTGYIAGAMVVRRSAFEEVGFFREDLRVGEFIEWYARAVEAGLGSRMLPDLVLLRRIHGNNTVLQQRSAQSDYLRILKAALDRRRGKTAR